ncbi:MAG: hypothetical protein HY790_09920, partial [Deltaproteobacteria bacterium]|nr:hypothetical protein [Deltaproteobacteria bacterium]
MAPKKESDKSPKSPKSPQSPAAKRQKASHPSPNPSPEVNKTGPQLGEKTGCVEFILNPGEMAQELAKISRHPFWTYYQTPIPAELLPEAEKELEPILLLLQKVTGVNFSLYKRNTLRRRIMRRMVLRKLDNLQSYLSFLKDNPAEVEALYQDVLIKVTGFFRDEGAFDVLKKTAFPEILAAKP